MKPIMLISYLPLHYKSIKVGYNGECVVVLIDG